LAAVQTGATPTIISEPYGIYQIVHIIHLLIGFFHRYAGIHQVES
jgi:hypothetical protein